MQGVTPSAFQDSSDLHSSSARLDDLPFYLAGLYHGFRGLIDRIGLDAGLHQRTVSPGMGSIYFALCDEDDCIIKSLAERLGIPNPTLTGLLDKLEDAGVVERHPCPNDGRAFRVRLTSLGRSLEPGMRERHQRGVEVLQAGLKESELRELKRLLGKVLTNLRADEEESRNTQRAERARLRVERLARERNGKRNGSHRANGKPTMRRRTKSL